MQFVHTDSPDVAANVPAVQFVHVAMDVAPVAAEYVPVAQFVHTDNPDVAVYVPAAQFVHTDNPDVAANVPAAQPTHAPPEDMVPRGHGVPYISHSDMLKLVAPLSRPDSVLTMST